MILATVKSKNGVKIRLTRERWTHIINSHLEVATKDFPGIMKVVSEPDVILKGETGEFLAVKKKSGSRIWYVVPYKEISHEDGFVLTAYLTTDPGWLLKKEVIWNKE